MIKIFKLDCTGCDYVGKGTWDGDGPEYNLNGNKSKRMAYMVDGTTVIDWECQHCSPENKAKAKL